MNNNIRDLSFAVGFQPGHATSIDTSALIHSLSKVYHTGTSFVKSCVDALDEIGDVVMEGFDWQDTSSNSEFSNAAFSKDISVHHSYARHLENSNCPEQMRNQIGVHFSNCTRPSGNDVRNIDRRVDPLQRSESPSDSPYYSNLNYRECRDVPRGLLVQRILSESPDNRLEPISEEFVIIGDPASVLVSSPGDEYFPLRY